MRKEGTPALHPQHPCLGWLRVFALGWVLRVKGGKGSRAQGKGFVTGSRSWCLDVWILESNVERFRVYRWGSKGFIQALNPKPQAFDFKVRGPGISCSVFTMAHG